MYYLCRQNNGTDQLSSYSTADLRLCFYICKKQVFLKSQLHSIWMENQHVFLYFQIFTEDLPEVESLPRSPILSFLENISKTNRSSKDLAIPYLVSTILDSI